ncbi:hypothetical protein KKG83_00515 [Candidatus Micrarchaeota archaeon]|nr:hypothetical protein [Candidatus Micrarchaeota archaeon]MBU2475934.1 hypothetical protein [Candidatus Micrarchaeota archaeon]
MPKKPASLSKPKKRWNPFKKRERYKGGISRETAKRIVKIKDERRYRAKVTGTAAGVGSLSGILVAVNPDLVSLIGTSAIALGVAGLYKSASKEVRKATRDLIGDLHNQSKNDSNFRDYVLKHKYIFIDKKGRITGSNYKGFGIGKVRIGRLRISREEILANENNTKAAA